MNLQNRVEKLEGRYEATDGCPECGHIPGGLVEFTLTKEGAAFDEPAPLIPMRLPDPERCARCGRVTRVAFSILPGTRESADGELRVDLES
jgi:rRNA maturation protein Nop10